MEVRGEGRAAFAAILLLIAGALNVIYGIAAIGVFALCVIVLHGLVVYGEPAERS